MNEIGYIFNEKRCKISKVNIRLRTDVYSIEVVIGDGFCNKPFMSENYDVWTAEIKKVGEK
jgi:hypothetical protein